MNVIPDPARKLMITRYPIAPNIRAQKDSQKVLKKALSR
jgi:hypothetical protein